MEIRPPNKPNYESLVPLIEEALGIKLGLQLLADRIWYDPDYDPNFNLMAREKGQVQGFLAGVLRGDQGFIKLLAVGSSFRRKGLASEMLGRIEDRLQGEGAKSISIGDAPPRDFFPGVPQRYAAASDFFRMQGYIEEKKLWTASFAPQGREDASLISLDFKRYKDLVTAVDKRWLDAVEEAFSFSSPQALALSVAGKDALLLARPGRLGPLFYQGDEGHPDLKKLVLAGAALSSSQGSSGLRDNRPLAWWESKLNISSSGSTTVFNKSL